MRKFLTTPDQRSRLSRLLLAAGVPFLAVLLLSGPQVLAQQKTDEVPDAPSATRPIPPPTIPSSRPPVTPAPDSSTDGAAAQGDDGAKAQPLDTPQENQPPRSSDTDTGPQTPGPPPPMPPVKTVPEGAVPRDMESREDLYTVTVTTNFVLVPVTVKDNQGRLVGGLLPKDFSVMENGEKQPLRFFTSDPFPLSAAVIFDLGMPDSGLRKVQETLSALQGAFSPFDEIGIYTYSSTVSRVSDFATVGQKLTAILNQIKNYTGANNGPPVTGGPLGPQGPIINGRPVDQPVQPVITPPRTARVINDAILMAARDLSRRDRARRKIIFVITDGREYGSNASYADTLKVLLTQNIIVYGVGVESAALPGYGKLQKIHVPKIGKVDFGYGNILPKYVSATGGGTVYSENAKLDIEKAYARAMGDARNQYTLGYAAKSGTGRYRRIEVVVKRPDVDVYARDGYYPLPAPKNQ